MPASSSSDYAYHYRKWFNDSDACFDGMSYQYERRLRYYGVPKSGDKVLEIGCGWGFCLGGLRDLGVTNAEGYDIDPVAIDLCKRRGLNAQLLDLADIHSFMEDRCGAYDTILALDVLEHIPLVSRGNVLRDILLALKPGGVFVCQVPNADSIIASHMRYVDHTHVDSFSQTSLDAELHNAGFEPARIIDADPPVSRPSVREIYQLKWWFIRLLFRKIMRAIYVAELGSEGYRVPLDKNITAIATRPKQVDASREGDLNCSLEL